MNGIRRNGFTLVELMVAIGILAIGAAMVASVFPVAMLENKKSVEHTMGALISENALALCRQKLRHSDLNNAVAVAEGKYTDVTEYITPAEAAYPMARLESETPAADWPSVEAQDWITVEGTTYPSARYGWMVSARQLRNIDSPTRTVDGLFVCPICNEAYLTRELAIKCRDAHDVRLNDYELSIIVYRKFLPTDRPGHELQFDPSYKKVNYVPEDPEENPNPRNPTVSCWVTRTSLQP